MSDPQTLEELRRMALELPKNVLVPAHHIHSLLDETERLVERVADLQRQLAEARAEVDRYKDHAHQRELEALTLGSQLAEKQAEIEAMRPMVERYRWLRSNDQAPSITGIWYGDFALDKAIDEARKQP